MKKLTFLAVMAIAAATFTSCGNSAPKANLKDKIDTLSFVAGYSNAQSLSGYLVQMGIDSTYIDTFLKGVTEGANAGEDKKQNAYFMGINIGQQIGNQMLKGLNMDAFGNDSTKTLSMSNFLAGLAAAVKNEKTFVTPMEARTKYDAMMSEVRAEQFKDVKAANEKFLVQKAKEPDVKKLPSGVLYKVIKEGTGAIPKDTSMVKVHYEGRTIDGTVFDSSYQRKEPTTFRVNQIIKGWTEALLHMPVGSTWEVYIPQELGYGSRQTGMRGEIKPFSTLIFKMELLSIEK